MEGSQEANSSGINKNRLRLDEAKGFGEVYAIVKETVKKTLGHHRTGIMLFLDDLPFHLGAYHQAGTNNIIMNRALLQIVESATKSRRVSNAFIYSILLHEYLHVIGYLREPKVRPLVYRVSQESFGKDHITTYMAKKGPWSILKGLPIDQIEAPKRIIEIVKDFERTNQKYIV